MGLNFAIAHWKPLSVALGLALAFGGGYAYRGKPPAPAVHAVEDTASQKAVAARRDELDRKGKEHEVTMNFAPPPPGCPHGKPVLVSETVTDRGPEVIETHATEQTRETAQTHLDLTVTPPAEKPGWAVGAGVSLTDKTLRLEVDRRLFGNLWVGGSIVPARREVGVGLRMEF